MNEKRVVVAMSGGVDSSVAALLLQKQGLEVIGMSMRLWAYEGEAKHGCCTPEDLYDARRVADVLGIPYYVLNFTDSFEEEVIRPFVRSYQRGQTPNPCVRCNQTVKFQSLRARARELGAKYLATGHYARREEAENGSFRLLRARDLGRDQSYFLYGMDQAELAEVLFPLGDLTKDEVRELAREHGLPVADKGDSQEICFVADDYADFVEKNSTSAELRPGEVVDEAGAVLGRHGGIHRFTVGQRKGLGVSGLDRRYVLAVHPDSGQVVVGDEDRLFRQDFRVGEMRWIHSPAQAGENLEVKIRSRFTPAAAEILSCEGDELALRFLEPQRAITPGQAAVFYRGEEVLGGGAIAEVG